MKNKKVSTTLCWKEHDQFTYLCELTKMKQSELIRMLIQETLKNFEEELKEKGEVSPAKQHNTSHR